MGNPHHDEKGRFASGPGRTSGGIYFQPLKTQPTSHYGGATKRGLVNPAKAAAQARARVTTAIEVARNAHAISHGKRAPNPANKASKFARGRFPYSNIYISAGDLANRASGKGRAQLSPRGRSTAGELAALRSTPGRAQIPGAAYGWTHANRRVGMAPAPRVRGFDRPPRRY